MLSLFEMAIGFLVMMLCINGMFFVFGGSVANIDFEYASQENLFISQEDVKETADTSENSAKEGDAFAAIFSFVSLLVGTVTGTIGAIAILLGPLFAFGNAWGYALETIFGGTGLLWNFLTLTIIPLINLMQVGSIAYIVLYAVSAVRGGSV